MSKITKMLQPCAGLAEVACAPDHRYSKAWQFDRMGDGTPVEHFGSRVATWDVQNLAGRVYRGARSPIDHTSHHYRASIGRDADGRAVALYVQQYHGGGHSAWAFGGEWPFIFDAVADETARFLLVDHAIQAVEDATRTGAQAEREVWRTAAAGKRIRTRVQPARGTVKVWIEPERDADESDVTYAARKRYAAG